MPLIDATDSAQLLKYQQFVAHSKYGFVTQDPAWGKVKKNWDMHCVYLEDGNGIRAAMTVLTIVAKNGKKLAYAPKGPVCDVYDVATMTALYREVESCLGTEDLFLLRSDPQVIYNDVLDKSLKDAGFIVRNKNVPPHSTIQPRLNMRIRIKDKTEDELLREFHSKTRYNIRLARRKGVTVDYAIPPCKAAVEEFYQTHVIMSERQGITHRPLDYFLRVIEAYPENSRIYVAKLDEEVLSAAVCLSYGDTTWYLYGGSTNEHRNFMPNYLMQWEMIRWGLERGTTYYDFGGIFTIDDSDGLYRFKKGFVGADNVSEYIGEIDRVYDESAYEEFLRS